LLKLLVGLVTATNLASIGLLAARGASWAEVGAAVGRFLDHGLEVVVLITLAAALAEWSLTRFKLLERWDPNSLRPIDRPLRVAERAAEHAAAQVHQTDGLVRRALDHVGPPLQVRSFAELVMLAVFACWGVLGLKFPYLIFASAASMLGWVPMIDRIFPVIVTGIVATLVDQYLRLTTPDAAFVRLMRVFWANVGWVLLVLVLLAGPEWVVWTGTAEQCARFGRIAGQTWSLVDVVNAVITTILVLAAVISLIGPCWRLRRLFGRRDTRTAHA
jgi:hypothetical protein